MDFRIHESKAIVTSRTRLPTLRESLLSTSPRPPALTPASSIAVKQGLPPVLVGVCIALLIIGGTGTNSVLAAIAVAILFLGSLLLWRPGESPVLIFVFGFQWLQASVKIFHANWLNVEINELSAFGGDSYSATALSLVALACLAGGMRLGAGPWRPRDGQQLRAEALHSSPKFWFYLYAIALAVAILVQAFAWVVAGLAQPLLALASLKWAFYWMLAYATFARPGAVRRYFWFAFGLEFAMGVGGYFSTFKSVLFFTAFALLAAGVRLSPKQYFSLGGLAAATLVFGLVWTAVKDDYRYIISGNQSAQIITVGYSERISVLYELISELDGERLSEAVTPMLNRVSYVDFFGRVLEVVPVSLPHASGNIWWDAISRPFMPRLFFPDKTAIHDSDRTNYYTGLNVAGATEGTSISIGYIGESYIDFGTIGMMIPIFTLGLFLGRIYIWMVTYDPRWPLLGMGLATATISGTTYLESSITKVFGTLVVTVLVSWLILWLAPRYFPLIKRWSAS